MMLQKPIWASAAHIGFYILTKAGGHTSIRHHACWKVVIGQDVHTTCVIGYNATRHDFGNMPHWCLLNNRTAQLSLLRVAPGRRQELQNS